MTITLPKSLARKLEGDKPLSGSIHQTLARFEPWLESSGMPFFSGFTDHGPRHLQRVLDTAVWLITKDTLALLTPRDVACLVLAVLFHDSAMHLTEDSFRALIGKSLTSTLIPELDSDSWGILWENYLLEAKHWEPAKCEQVLGAAWRAKSITQLSIYHRRDLEDLRESDRLFIGEFIRRHHARMAHEFALFGVPGPGASLRAVEPSGCPALIDLAGLIARSHGMSIRGTFPYLEKRHSGVHRMYETVPVFLMGVLRIADYLDLHAERAPEELLKVKILRSFVSQREWRAHQAITDIRYGGSNDPERIEVIANPQSASEYSSILRWVRGIQEELDHTWAVLGEVYGGSDRLRLLALRLRRITSPLEDEGRFAADKRLPFVPRLAQFTVSSGDLLPMLAKPLYGDRPEVGIRELLQNAVDAVNELRALVEKKIISTTIVDELNLLPAEFDCDVLVSICERTGDWPSDSVEVPSDWQWWVEVADRGLGMTPDVIRQHFLRAGSTFRRSIDWIRTFKEAQQATVIRSGRFGIGTLASFALGDQLQVTTRNYSEAGMGTTFVARLDDDAIELRRVQASIGTTVRVRIDPTIGKELLRDEGRWDWFCLDTPRVRRIIRRGKEAEVVEAAMSVSLNDPRSGGWRTAHVPAFDFVLWNSRVAPAKLYCNGIRVGGSRSYSVSVLKDPVVIVVDREGNLPLNIAREELTQKPSYTSAVKRGMLLEHCAWLIDQATVGPSERNSLGSPVWNCDSHMESISMLPSYATSPEGIVPLTPWHLYSSNIPCLLVEISFNERDPVSCLRADPINCLRVPFDARVRFEERIEGEEARKRRFLELVEFLTSWTHLELTCAVVSSSAFEIIRGSMYYCGLEVGSAAGLPNEQATFFRLPNFGHDNNWVTLVDFNLVEHFHGQGKAVLGFRPLDPRRRRSNYNSHQSLSPRLERDEVASFVEVWKYLRLPVLLPFEDNLRKKACYFAQMMLKKLAEENEIHF